MQLPDYHDVIKHPMDFATVRKKLANGAYPTLEQFEVYTAVNACFLFSYRDFVCFAMDLNVDCARQWRGYLD
jgi:hypothetical protein